MSYAITSDAPHPLTEKLRKAVLDSLSRYGMAHGPKLVTFFKLVGCSERDAYILAREIKNDQFVTIRNNATHLSQATETIARTIGLDHVNGFDLLNLREKLGFIPTIPPQLKVQLYKTHKQTYADLCQCFLNLNLSGIEALKCAKDIRDGLFEIQTSRGAFPTKAWQLLKTHYNLSLADPSQETRAIATAPVPSQEARQTATLEDQENALLQALVRARRELIEATVALPQALAVLKGWYQKGKIKGFFTELLPQDEKDEQARAGMQAQRLALTATLCAYCCDAPPAENDPAKGLYDAARSALAIAIEGLYPKQILWARLKEELGVRASDATPAHVIAQWHKAYSELKSVEHNLVVAHTSLAVNLAHKYAKDDPHIVDDLSSEGYIGLMEAVTTWSPHRGDGFFSHAFRCCRREILKGIAEKGYYHKVRLHTTAFKQVGKFQNAYARLEHDLGRTPTHAELAAQTGFTEKKVKDMSFMYLRPASLEADLHEANPQETGFQARINRLSSLVPTPDKVFEEKERAEKIGALLGTLSAREELVLRLVFGLGCATEEGTPRQEIAALCKRTRRSIQTTRKDALEQLEYPVRRKVLKALYDDWSP